MKILCVSDQIDPLVYSETIKERFANIDAILCAGDLPSDYIDFIVSSLNKPTFFIFGNHNLKEFGYYHKNHRNQRDMAQSQMMRASMNYEMSCCHGATYVGFKVLKEKSLKIKGKNGKERPLLIGGVSGSIRYNNGLSQYTEFQMFTHLLKLTPALFWNKIRYGTYLDIFLTHASPRHIHDKEDPCHKGFECFNWFIKHFSPKYLVHGHIHLYDINSQRITKSEHTTVVNAYSYVIIELNDIETDETGSK